MGSWSIYIIGWSVLDRKKGLNSDASRSKSMKEVSYMKSTNCIHMMSAIPSNTLERKQYWGRLLGDTNAMCDSGQFSLMSDLVLCTHVRFSIISDLISCQVPELKRKERSLLLLITLFYRKCLCWNSMDLTVSLLV